MNITTLILLTTMASIPHAEFREVFDRLSLENGLVRDRISDEGTVSCAATGFVAYAKAVYVQRVEGDRDQVLYQLKRGFRTTVMANPGKNRGWLAHFTDGEGNPKSYSEVSTIDTALFYLGFLKAAEVMRDAEFEKEVRDYLSKVDVDWMVRDGYFVHGLHWNAGSDEPKFIEHNWNDTSEGILLYQLFGREFKPEVQRVDFPLFVYCYPLCFFDDDKYVGYLNQAIDYQLQRFGYCGITATDGPDGYAVDDQQVISPLLLSALSARFPQAQVTLEKHRLNPRVPAYHISTGWAADDQIAIDYASAFLLSVNWKETTQVAEAE
ncbi:hypothetical protein [Calycomorphotria hydatis]|uniref:Uncharacterized protein n=1 Tax=Calycomorphotria hydatis TaxID=2528027 RepID=A0A517T568_9PLAN|nr:hypothetical protein [Calycomorphotria hydatis]QDT63526.1 hypothetical protein V22_07480 [Calycomorphotria hydatis]